MNFEYLMLLAFVHLFVLELVFVGLLLMAGKVIIRYWFNEREEFQKRLLTFEPDVKVH